MPPSEEEGLKTGTRARRLALRTIGASHTLLARDRRVEALSAHLSRLIPSGSRTLDVGCGDGRITKRLAEQRPDLRLVGIDVLDRATAVPVVRFDGCRIPFEDEAFDAVLLIDVLHHAEDPEALLAEALRVARRCVVLKDHFRQGLLASQTLRLMDWFGNRPHGVVLRYHYLRPVEWQALFDRLGLRVVQEVPRLGLYPPPFRWLFERSLHFLARLERRNS